MNQEEERTRGIKQREDNSLVLLPSTYFILFYFFLSKHILIGYLTFKHFLSATTHHQAIISNHPNLYAIAGDEKPVAYRKEEIETAEQRYSQCFASVNFFFW